MTNDVELTYDTICVIDLREDKDITQQELADYLSISRGAYSNYENGIREVPLSVLCAIADFYHTSVDYLLDRTDKSKPYPPKRKG